MQQGKDLYYLSTELIDTKVDMATSKAMDRVIEQMYDFKTEMHNGFAEIRFEMQTGFAEIRSEMHNGFAEAKSRSAALENRMTAVETKLGMVNATQKEIRTRFIEYAFRGGWLIFGIGLSYLIMHFHA